MKKSLSFISLITLLPAAYAASFDCNKASTFVEKSICSDTTASKLDEVLAIQYKDALGRSENPDGLKAEQKSWLKTVRNQCKSLACIQSSINERISELAEKSTPDKTSFSIDGQYESKEGDLEINTVGDKVFFRLLVVNAKGNIGEASGSITVKNNSAIYQNKSQDCQLQFNFTEKAVKVNQMGDCEMGIGVTASGTYKSINAPSVTGKVGDSLGSLFYSESETTYKKYCMAGMEENSGNIICKAKGKSGEDCQTIIYIFSGDYEGPDGELPPLSIAKKYKIVSTVNLKCNATQR